MLFELYCVLDLSLQQNPNKDYGIDLVKDKIAYQCKNWSTSLTYKDLSTFIASSFIEGYEKMVLLFSFKDQKVPIKYIENKIEYKHIEMDQTKIQTWLNTKIEFPQLKQETSLRKCQIECLEKMNQIQQDDEDDEGIYNFLLHTGSGKTRIMVEFIQQHEDCTFLVLVPSIALMNQFPLKEEVSLYGTNESEDKEPNRISVCVYNSFYKIKDFQFDYVFIDEAHHVYRPDIFNMILGEDVSMIGDDQTYIDLIREITDSKIFCFSATLDRENLSYEYTLNQAVEDKIIVDYELNFLVHSGDILELNMINLKDKKTIIYCSKIEDCKQVSQKLGCKYLSGDMSMKERQILLDDFRDNQQFICSVRTLSEGIDLPYVDSCIFYSEKNSQIDIIQCIGRAQRLFQGKEVARIYVLINEDDDVQKKVNKYCKCLFDFDKHCQRKIKVYQNKLIQRTQKQLEVGELIDQIVVQSCSKLVRTDEWKLEMCRQFYNEFRRLPKREEIFKDFRIGYFIADMKSGYNKHLKQQVLQIFEIQELKTKEMIPDERKLQLCQEFYQKFERLPQSRETIGEFKIGQFINNIKRGKCQQHLKQRIQQIFKMEEPKTQTKEMKERIPDKQKLEMCRQFYQKFKRLPQSKETIGEFKIGSFITVIKSGQNKHLKEQVLQIFEIQELKPKTQTKEMKERIPDEQKLEMCRQFYNEFERLPKFAEIYKEFKIGGFIANIKSGQNNQHLKQQVLQIFETQELKTKEMIPDEQKLEMCRQFYQEFKILPKDKEVYKDFNIGSFIRGIKRGYRQHLKQQIWQIFNIE